MGLSLRVIPSGDVFLLAVVNTHTEFYCLALEMSVFDTRMDAIAAAREIMYCPPYTYFEGKDGPCRIDRLLKKCPECGVECPVLYISGEGETISCKECNELIRI